MKSLFLLGFILLTLTSCGNSSNSDSNYLSQNVMLYDPNSVGDLIKQQKIKKTQMLDSLHSLKESLKASYIGYNLKKSLIGKSGDEIFNHCFSVAEKSQESLTSYEVYDVVLQCLAGFQDTHLNLHQAIAPANIASPVSQAELIDGKLYIARIRTNLIRKIEERQKLDVFTLLRQIDVGTEILSINGKLPLEEIQKLEKYVSASSPSATRHEALLRLFVRDFAYPESKDLKLKLKNAFDEVYDVTLPWVFLMDNKNIESRIWLSEKGFTKSTEFEFSNEDELLKSDGFRLDDPLYSNLSSKRTYLDSESDPVVITGLTKIKNKNVCYLQLKSFEFESDKNLTYKFYEKINDTTYTLGLINELKNFLGQCENFSVPLILDLRANGGGDSSIAELIYSLFHKENAPLIYPAKMQYLNTGNNVFLYQSINRMDKASPSLENSLNFTAIKSALDQRKSLTDWILLKDTSFDQTAFTGPVYLLTSEFCISACDRTVNHFKLSQRAKIIGTSTNGTGFGFSYYGDSKTTYHDLLNLYEVNIPNFAFSNALVKSDADFNSDGDTKGTLLSSDKVNILENRPTQPDVVLKYTVDDLKFNYNDYTQSLGDIIFKK